MEQATETTLAALYTCEELASQLSSHQASSFRIMVAHGAAKEPKNPRPE